MVGWEANCPGNLILLGQQPFIIAFKSKSALEVIYFMTTCSTVYKLQIWQMLDSSQMFSVVFMCCFYGGHTISASPSSLCAIHYLPYFQFFFNFKKVKAIFAIRNCTSA